MKISQFPATSFSENVKIPVVAAGSNYSLSGSDLLDMLILSNDTNQDVRCAVPLVAHSWGTATKYVGIRIDHLLSSGRMHMDFSITVHQYLSNLSAKACVCMLRNPPAEANVLVHSDKHGSADAFTFSGFYVQDNKTWLVLEICQSDALMHISVDGLCCHYGYQPNTDTAKNRFSNYEVKLFLSGLPTQTITL